MLTVSGKPPLPSDAQLPSRVISLEGWGALWRGLRPAIARDCVFGGMFFSTWQFIHTSMLTWKAVNMNPEPRSWHHVNIFDMECKRDSVITEFCDASSQETRRSRPCASCSF
jgi:hypothetical protein